MGNAAAAAGNATLNIVPPAGPMNQFTFATSGAIREIIVLGHEMMTGNFSRIPGSLVVMTERMGGLGTAVNALTGMMSGGFAVAGGAALAAAAATAYFAYEAYQGSAAVRDTYNNLLLLGQGLNVSKSDVEGWRDTFTSRFNQSSGSAREVMQYVDKIGDAANAQRPKIMNLVQAFASINNMSLSAGTEKFEKMFGTTSSSFLKGAEDIKAISPELANLASRLNKSGEESAGLAVILQALDDRFGKAGESVRDTTVQLQAYLNLVSGMQGMAPPPGLDVLGGLDVSKLKPNPNDMAPAESPLQRAAGAAVVQGSPELSKQADILRAITVLSERRAELEKEMQGLTEGTTASEGKRLEISKNLADITRTIRNLTVESSTIKGKDEQDTFKRAQLGFEEEVRAAENNQTKIAEIRRRQAAYNAEYWGEHTTQALEGFNRETDAARAAADQQFNLFVELQHRKQIEAASDLNTQMRLQREILSGMRARGEDASQPERYSAEQSKQSALANQIAEQNYQRFAAAERQKLQEASKNWTQIRQIYQEWASEAARLFGKTGNQWAEVQTEMARAAQRAVDDQIRETMRQTEMKSRIDNAYLETFRRNMEAQVREHKITATQAAGYQIEYTAQLYTQLAAQYDAILANENLKQDVREEFQLKRLQLEADYARAVASEQDKIAAAADKSSKQMAEAFKRSFDQVGSAIEQVITGALDRTMTRVQAAQQLRQALIRGVVGLGGSIASQLAGQQLAKSLGVETEAGKDTTLGSVISSWVTKAIGLGPGKTDESLKTAQQNLTEVTKKSGNYVELNTQAIKDLTTKIDQAKSIGAGAQISRGGPGGAGPTPAELRGGASGERDLTSPTLRGTSTFNITGPSSVNVPSPTVGRDSPELAQDFHTRLDAALADARSSGMDVSKGSLFRPVSQQVAGIGHAKPGGSLHGYGDQVEQLGLANDLRGAGGEQLSQAELERMRPFLAKQGLWAPLENWSEKKEPWHIEPVEARGGRWSGRGSGGGSDPDAAALKQAVNENSTAVKGLSTETTQAKTAMSDDANVTRSNTAEAQKGTTATTEDSRSTQSSASEISKNTQALTKLTTTIESKGTGTGTGGGNKDTGTPSTTGSGGTSSSSSTSTSTGSTWDALTRVGSGLSALAGGLALVSPRMRVLGGALSLVTGLPSAIKNLSSGFDLLFGGSTKLASAKVIEQAATTLGTATKNTDTAVTATGVAVKGTAATTETALTGAKVLGQAAETGHTAAVVTDEAALQAHAAGAATSGVGSALGGIGSLFKAIPFIGGLFGYAGMVVPSAAGGMKVDDGRGGTLAVIHPREMVLPADLSDGVQNMIHNTASGGNRSGGGGSNTTTLNYNANVSGYHPFATRSSFEGLMRRNSNSMMRWAENAARNGWRPAGF
jgi:hypothetical protein